MIQGGDPTQSGAGGPGYSTVDVPPSDAKYTKGVVAMAKSGVEAPGTSGSQFFVVTGEDAGLPPDYAIVGEVTDGMDTVDAHRRARGRRRPAVAAGRRVERHRRRELTMRVAAIVLAAGEASRFGSPKQRILLPLVLERLRETSVDEIVVVEGAYELAIDDTRVVHCPDWERGPGASLRCGLAALAEDVEAAVVVLADGPYLAPRRSSASSTTGARTEESSQRRTPAPAATRSCSAAPTGTDVPDDGLRDRAVRLVPCDDLGAPGDVDVPEDLERL